MPTNAIITHTGGIAQNELASERGGDPQVPRVVRQHIVVDAQIEPAGIACAERSGISTDEEVLVAVADAADQCGGRTFRQRAVWIERRIAFAFGAIAAIASQRVSP